MDGPTHLERIGPKGWLRYVFPFQLEEEYNIDEISRIFKDGFDSAKKRLPAMGCEAVPAPELSQIGVLKLQQIPEGDIEAITVNDLRAEGAFPMSFSELKSKRFPVSALEATKICPRSVWPVAGDRLPVSQVKLNFIQGGVIMGWNLFHQFGDSVTYYTWSQVWAEECRRAQGEHIDNPIHLPDEIFAHRAQLKKPSGLNAGRVEDHPEYLVLPFTPQGAPPKMLSTSHRGQVFYFSPEALAALKKEASPSNATDPQPTDTKYISTNDALSALLWRTIMAAQNPPESLGDTDPVSTFAIAIDGRLRTDPPVHPQTQGCFLEYVGVEMPIHEMHLGNLADVAIKIRASVAKADKNLTDDVVSLVDGLQNVDRIIPKAFTDVPGFNCVQTSWVKFKVYDISWGRALGGKISAVRSPEVGVINGCQVILPAPPHGGLEVIVGLEETSLDHLRHNELWNRFAEAV
ncbi:transferase family-domain-containing protein [Coniella lustricola]|uniref:Transferase family-domain-containing protein n=1 Tax=Coniella lustricola TaxID=2025994 RepID=A0A2T3A4P5_9PEZI|nr:transferase family-domain-containing protein [Coniella lustricola]